ncbi:MAG: hypothetical protein U0798_17470 [Gemmataceae bacterium]
MANDPRQLKPAALCRLLNSTPLGEVVYESMLRKHRNQAGHRIGTGNTVDLLRYTGWLVSRRHNTSRTTKPDPDQTANQYRDELARQAASHVSNGSAKREQVLAALLSEPTYARAAENAGIGETTLYRWLKKPSFRKSLDKARKELVATAVGNLQTATGEAVEALTTVARKGKRDGDRVRAAVALLEHAWRGMLQSDLFHDPERQDDTPAKTDEVVSVLTRRLRALETTNMPSAEKARLTVSMADALLRAIGVDQLEQRMSALESVFQNRKDAK